MGIGRKAGDIAFKAFTAGLGVATIYLTASFSFNVYRGLSWHNAQSEMFLQSTWSRAPGPVMGPSNLWYHLHAKRKMPSTSMKLEKVGTSDEGEQ